MRSGEQAALAHDLLDLIDALALDRPVVGGYDWGGRAACIVAALHPSRVRGLVTVGGYNVFDPAAPPEPMRPEWERTYWYKYYFQNERGRRGLERYRDELCELLWTSWSPEWADAASAFRASAASLRQPRLRRRGHPLVPAPRRAGRRATPATRPPRRRSPRLRTISVPTVVLESGADGIGGPSGALDRDRFTGRYSFRELPGIGHDLPQEAPREFAEAVLGLI